MRVKEFWTKFKRILYFRVGTATITISFPILTCNFDVAIYVSNPIDFLKEAYNNFQKYMAIPPYKLKLAKLYNASKVQLTQKEQNLIEVLFKIDPELRERFSKIPDEVLEATSEFLIAVFLKYMDVMINKKDVEELRIWFNEHFLHEKKSLLANVTAFLGVGSQATRSKVLQNKKTIVPVSALVLYAMIEGLKYTQPSQKMYSCLKTDLSNLVEMLISNHNEVKKHFSSMKADNLWMNSDSYISLMNFIKNEENLARADQNLQMFYNKERILQNQI